MYDSGHVLETDSSNVIEVQNLKLFQGSDQILEFVGVIQWNVYLEMGNVLASIKRLLVNC